LLLIVLLSCEKDSVQPEPSEPVYNGTATALFNGEERELLPILFYSYQSDSTVTANFDIVVGGVRRFTVSFARVSLDTSRQTLHNRTPNGSGRTFPDGSAATSFDDVAKNSYDINEHDDFPDFIKFTHLDIEKREAEGVFQVSLLVDSLPGNIDPAWPDTLIISDGHFKTELQEWR